MSTNYLHIICFIPDLFVASHIMLLVTASIVTYNPPVEELLSCIDLVAASCVKQLWIIDNSPDNFLYSVISDYAESTQLDIKYIHNNTNLGFGRAHNIAISRSIDTGSDLHLVMNHDVRFNPQDITKLATYMQEHMSVAQVIPNIVYPSGERQNVVRLLPTPLDVFGRRFLPSSWMKRRNSRYTLSDWDHSFPLNIPYHQGSFILFRTSCLKSIGGFDPRFFLYPEDIDITRRMHKSWSTMFYPEVTITHYHQQGSYHNLCLMMIHCINMIRYFNKWGWWHDPERRKWNRSVIKEISCSSDDKA